MSDNNAKKVEVEEKDDENLFSKVKGFLATTLVKNSKQEAEGDSSVETKEKVEMTVAEAMLSSINETKEEVTVNAAVADDESSEAISDKVRAVVGIFMAGDDTCEPIELETKEMPVLNEATFVGEPGVVADLNTATFVGEPQVEEVLNEVTLTEVPEAEQVVVLNEATFEGEPGTVVAALIGATFVGEPGVVADLNTATFVGEPQVVEQVTVTVNQADKEQEIAEQAVVLNEATFEGEPGTVVAAALIGATFVGEPEIVADLNEATFVGEPQVEEEVAVLNEVTITEVPEAEQALVLNEAVESVEEIEHIAVLAEAADMDLKVEIDTMSSEISQCLDNLLENQDKTRFCNDFNITGDVYDLVESFYNENKENDLIANGFLRKIITECIKERSVVNASEMDIERALAAIDSNNDDKINFEQLLRLLVLFFSSKNNFCHRIEMVLNNESNCHNTAGSLNSDEMVKFEKFLVNFYGQAEEEEVEGEQKDKKVSYFASLIGKMVKKMKGGNKDDDDKDSELENCLESPMVEYKKFSCEAAEQLEAALFVKFPELELEQVEVCAEEIKMD